ncbi:MAG: carboxylating nicotinate-nucleotide diphosphorylase [Calditrichaeota bacterium]|nr:MAG: carboxylating nicotinate-nucleotide diphosphorylase [Calditrichota bacterium]
MHDLNWSKVDKIILEALAEDIGSGDITTASVTENLPVCTAKIVSKTNGILSGLKIVERAFSLHDKHIHLDRLAEEGENITPGQILMTINGPGKTILAVERTALNLLGRSSGIASLTNKYVKAVAGTHAIILDTRKTAPLLRELDKYSVRAGCGQNHRTGLYDMILIKENHVRFAGGIEPALKNAIRYRDDQAPDIKIEIEVTNLDELEIACSFKVDRIMLDNFSLPDLSAAVAQINGAIELEASGGVTLNSVAEIAATGVDFISVGALTHSVENADFSLLFE